MYNKTEFQHYGIYTYHIFNVFIQCMTKALYIIQELQQPMNA